MMVKKTYLIIVVIALGTSCYGQGNFGKNERKKLVQADILFSQNDWYAARYLYWELYRIDTTDADVNYKLGTCMLNMRGKEDSAVSFLEYARYNNITEAYFELGKAYHYQGKFELAQKTFLYYKMKPDHAQPISLVDHYINITKNAIEQYDQPIDAKIENIGSGVNTTYSEYVPIVTADDSILYFTSRRKGSTGELKDPNGMYFEDIYYSVNNNGKWSSPVNMGTRINSPTHDATVGISANGNTLLIYRTNENLTGGDLYITIFDGKEWSIPSKLGDEINSEYQEPSACISADESILYFSSNRPGGMGGKDIYRVKKLPTQGWSLPQNLGPIINTEYDEDAPFLMPDNNTLYFSSNNDNSMGGYDIFYSTLSDGIWSVPKNVGYPLNTIHDDIYFSITADGKTGYYSSEQEGGFGKQDIYKVVLPNVENDLQVITGYIKDFNTNTGIKAKVTIIDEQTRKLQGIYSTNAISGKFIMIMLPGIQYQIIVEAVNYNPNILYFEINQNHTETESQEILLKKDE